MTKTLFALIVFFLNYKCVSLAGRPLVHVRRLVAWHDVGRVPRCIRKTPPVPTPDRTSRSLHADFGGK